MPKWIEVNKHWRENESGRHLDMLSLLWLHPSDDYEVLAPLRDAYLKGRWSGRKGRDLAAGIYLLYTLGVGCPLDNGRDPNFHGEEMQPDEMLYSLGDKAAVLTRLMCEICSLEESGSDDLREEHRVVERQPMRDRVDESHDIHFMMLTDWLCLPAINEYGDTLIYQHAIALEILLDGLAAWMAELPDRVTESMYAKSFAKPLYRIHHFDCEAEGDTARSRIVTMLRKELDRRDWAPHFSAIWEATKAGRLDVADPWEE